MSEELTVATPSEACQRMEERRKLHRDLLEGEAAMIKAATAYLPREPGEIPVPHPQGGSIDPYEVRLKRSTLYPFFSSAVGSLVGRVIGKDFRRGEDIPDPLAARLENINNEGAKLSVFAKPLFHDMWTQGNPMVLVDSTGRSRTDGPVRKADEQGVPYWIFYKSNAIIRAWKTSKDGRRVWRRIHIMDPAEEGRWGSVCAPRIRVLLGDGEKSEIDGSTYGARFEFWRPDPKNQAKWLPSWVEDEQPGRLSDHVELPVVFFPFGRVVSDEEVYSALEHLGNLCKAHWQAYSDQKRLVHIVKSSLLYWKGMTKADYIKDNPATFVGPFAMFFGGDDLRILESNGSGAKIGTEDLKRLEAQIRMASMLPVNPEKVQTLGQSLIDTTQSEATLRDAALALKDGLEQLLIITASQMGLPAVEGSGMATGGTILVPTEFALTGAEEQELRTLAEARARGDLSRQTWFEATRESVEALRDVTWEIEEERLRKERPDLLEILKNHPYAGDINEIRAHGGLPRDSKLDGIRAVPLGVTLTSGVEEPEEPEPEPPVPVPVPSQPPPKGEP